MTHTSESARTAVLDHFRTAWLASGTTSAIELRWDDVEAGQKKVEHDANGLPLPWARASVRTISGVQDSLGGSGVGKYQTEAILAVEIYVAPGGGHTAADAIVAVLKAAFRGAQIGSLWFYDVTPRERGLDGAWSRTDFLAPFRYQEAT